MGALVIKSSDKYQKRLWGNRLHVNRTGLRNGRQIAVFNPLDGSPQQEGAPDWVDRLRVTRIGHGNGKGKLLIVCVL